MPRMKCFVLLFSASFGIAACSNQSIVPKPINGALAAQLNNRVTSDDDESNSRAFGVLELDGVHVRNAVFESGRIGFGAGAGIVPYMIVRTVQIKPYQVRIAGRYLVLAPMDSIVRSANGRNQSVDGTVSSTPAPDHVYRVNGRLSPVDSAVWIEDFQTGEVVSGSVQSRD